MAIRLHELHPTLVHYPLALFPAALLSDLVGRLTGSERLMRLGARLMPIAATSAVVTGAAGLVAQEAVRAEGEAHDLLTTHRNLNLGFIGLTLALCAARARQEKPGFGYLLAGLGGMAAITYSAYLGGKMVYQHGVGVQAAGGVEESASPELRRHTAGEALRTAGSHALHGARHAARHLREGRVAPALRR